MERNIFLLFIIRICNWFMLYMPIVKLFYEENGLDNFDLFLLHAIYSALIFIVEVPSGYLADVIGRKKTMIIGMVMGVAGFYLYSVGSGFWGFLFAEIALGIGEGFISGADSAILYDTLLQKKKTQKYLKFEGGISGTGNLAEALAGIFVTVTAFSALRYYYYLQTAITAIGLFGSFFLFEPKVHAPGKEITWNSILQVVKNTLWRNPELNRYIIFSALIGFSSLSMAWFAQIFMYDAKIPYRYFGIIWAALNSIAALGSALSHRIDNLLGRINSLYYIMFFIVGGFYLIGMAIAPAGLLFLSLFYFVRGTAHPILKDRIQKYTPSNVRATVLSVRSLLIRIMFALFGPFLGVITEKINLSAALLISGTVVLIPGIFLIFGIIRKEKQQFS